jgi:hypothetical protein
MIAQSRRGRFRGYVAAALLFLLGWTSFDQWILLGALAIAAVSIYLGIRYDRNRNRSRSNLRHYRANGWETDRR